MNHYHINTTQNVELEFQIASLGDRILAYLLDSLILFLYAIVVFLSINFSIGFDEASPWFLLFLTPYFIYVLLCEIFLNGQTFGKMIMKIRVIMENGDELTIGSCFIRWVFRLVDITMFSGMVAIIAIAVSKKGQRLGDMAAGTSVLKIESGSQFEETVFAKLPEEYKPTYPEVGLLSDSDIQTIREVLQLAKEDKDYSNGAPHPLLMKTKGVVEKKMKVASKMPSKNFLETVILDFNFFHQ